MSLGAILIYCGIAATFTVIPFVVDYMYLHRVSPCTFSSVSLYHRPSFCILMYPMYPAGFFNIEKHHGHHCPKEKPWDFLHCYLPSAGGPQVKIPETFFTSSWVAYSSIPSTCRGHWAIGPLEPSPVPRVPSTPNRPNRPIRRIRRLVVVDALSKDQAFCKKTSVNLAILF